MKINECILEHLSIQCDIAQGSPLLLILFLFYIADFLEICSSITLNLSAGIFIDNTSLLAISLFTKKNYFNLAKAHKKYIK